MAEVSVGVVIPTFQRVDQTIAAVQSVLGQTRSPDQVVVVDDGSSTAVVSSLKNRLAALPVDLVTIEHTSHPGRARNVALARMRTTHVAFLDSDDVWLPDKLAVQALLAQQGIAAQFTGITNGGVEVGIDTRDEPELLYVSFDALLRGNRICNSTVMLERSLLDEIGGIPSSFAVRGIEDYAAWLRIATLTDWIGIPNQLVQYTDEPFNSIRSTKQCLIDEHVLALLDLTAWLESRGRRPSAALRLSSQLFRRSLSRWARTADRHRRLPEIRLAE